RASFASFPAGSTRSGSSGASRRAQRLRALRYGRLRFCGRTLRTMLPFLAALVLAATPVHRPAAANQADLSVRVAAPPPSDAWATASFHVTVSNAGPATVQNPHVTATVSGAQAYCPWVPPLDPGKSASVDCQALLTD